MLNPPFSIVLPVKSESRLLRKSLPPCFGARPEEVIVCLDDPPHEESIREAKRIACRFGFANRTKIVTVAKNPDYRFHQAWVRREGFRRAKHDRILTVDVDILLNKNVLKAVTLVGKDNVGLVSCTTLHSIKGPLGLWRASVHRLASQFRQPALTGLYAIWRPYWLDSENEGIKQLQDARVMNVKGSLTLIGEDTYLCNCIRVKHRCIHLADIGGYSLRDDCNDRPSIQFEIGRYYAEKGCGFGKVLLKSLALARIHYIRGYLYQKERKEPIPTFNPETYLHLGPTVNKATG